VISARRAALVSATGLLLAVSYAAPGGAQQDRTTEVLITYAAQSASTGFFLAITPPEEEEPAAGVSGAATTGSIASEVPSAEGLATVLAAFGEATGEAKTSAPPDESQEAESEIPPITVPGVGTIGVLQGTAASESEAEDGLPSTANAADFTGVELRLGTLELPDPIGDVGALVTVAQASTEANAAASGGRDIASADANSSGVTVSADLTLDLLQPLCEALAELPDPVGGLCEDVTGQDPGQFLAEIVMGPSTVACSWNGDRADCQGQAALGTLEIPALDIEEEVAPGETVTIPPDPGPTDPFLIRITAGDFNEEVQNEREDGLVRSSATAISSGLSIELLGAAAEGPGLVTFAVGESTAGVNGQVETNTTIARTGGPVLPLLAGGAALVAAGVGLRRFLKRR
jgi:hypothetical protein